MEYQEPDMLLCERCSEKEVGGVIELGVVPAERVTVKAKDGSDIVLHESDMTVVKMPTKLRRVVEKLPDGRCRLSCGHWRLSLPLLSAQEKFTLMSGEVVHGKLPL